MSSFDEKGPQHRNALAQVDKARQNALRAVSESRKAPPPAHHPNLAPTSDTGEELAVLCTQAVVDYLLQLRPYRASSTTWGIDFGSVQLPKKIEGSRSSVAFGRSNPPLWICRQPDFPLSNVSQLIKAANTTVQYSTNHPPNHKESQKGRRRDTVSVSVDGSERELTRKSKQLLLNGEITPEEAHQRSPPTKTTRADGGEDDYIPASPIVDSRGGMGRRKGRVESFKLVFPSATLLRIVELADEVAAELNMLAELKPPGKEDSEGF